MGLDIFFGEDIQNAILAAEEASGAMAEVAAAAQVAQLNALYAELRQVIPPGEGQMILAALQECMARFDPVRLFRAGYRSALTTIALAFGANPQTLLRRRQEGGLLPPVGRKEARIE